MKIINKNFFMGISLILIISLFFMSSATASTITVTAKPSANNNLAYKDYTITWENHCPLCGHEGTLVFNPKGTYEGELTCSHCGADYCAVTGKDKNWKGPRACLKHHVEKNNTTNYENYNLMNNTSENYQQILFRSILLNIINFTLYPQITVLGNMIN